MIEVSGLTKTFGDVVAIKNISFSVAAGEVFGLLGPNGAGKTTTLRILATLLRADSGSATVDGHDVVTEDETVRAQIGVVNGGMGLYDRLSGREILHYFGKLYGMKRNQIDARIDELDGLLELGDTLERRAEGFSTGMKQKIVVARAVLHDPPVIFFDEATSGLDVMARRSVLDFVKDYPSHNRAVIYSTHVMSEVDELCDRAGIIYRGELIAIDRIEALKEQTGSDSLERAFFRLVERSHTGSPNTDQKTGQKTEVSA
ncbi:MAG: ATP-binding cassette domain-containing protein [Trueperaceae bacterium]|nr:ATP-binding cassette domain-containing protein [Trueperaceae bacterium]